MFLTKSTLSWYTISMDSDVYAELAQSLDGEDFYFIKREIKTMQIQMIATSVETKPTAKGTTYQQLEVTYKNLTFQGKVESKKLMSFGANASAFKALAEASPGSQWEVDVTKNAQGYNDWTKVVAASAAPAVPTAATATKAQIGARSTYETPEERAQRQVLIVRQSCLNVACNTLAVGSKGVKPEDVLALAKIYENYVFDIKDPGPSGFEDLPDFDVAEVS